MANTFIAGYFAALSIDGDDLEGDLGSGVMTRNKNITRKPVAGDQDVAALPGVITGSISASGFLSISAIVDLNAAWVSNTPLVYVWQLGDAGTPDGGAYGGNLLIESLSVAFDTEDIFSFTLNAVLSGAATYTPA